MKEWETTDFLGKVRFVKDPKKSLMEFINSKGLITLLPLEIDKGTYMGFEQIRISKLDYEKLKDETKEILKNFANPPLDMNGVYSDYPELKKLYEETHYWKNCDAYLFEYETDGYWIKYAGKWGYEGMEEEKMIRFIKCDQYPNIIMKNLGCSEREGGNKLFCEKVEE